ncbi:hypothetical protein AOCH_007662 [Aspergillus ochraceoroseus]|nr:hypothetical protein AOCH_007662 [Aspergillus ochraceoroseus]
MAEEKAEQINAAENERLDELMAKFTKGFDPGTYAKEIRASLPKLVTNLAPGSYNHLLALVFETYDRFQSLQIDMEAWLQHRYQRAKIARPSNICITDETLFALEVEMLRKLLEPIREGSNKDVFWLSTRRAAPTWACEQLEESAKVIEVFKTDICSALKSPDTTRTIYINLPVSVKRTAIISIKQSRLDACKESLSWDKYTGSDLEMTAFYQLYKSYVSTNDPARARASGWLPPLCPQTPRSSAPEAQEGDLAKWPASEPTENIHELLLKTALWLGVARGLAAVHLFCDVARLFALTGPPAEVTDEHLCFLQNLTHLRSEGTRAFLSPPLPCDATTLPTRNMDYFADVQRSGHRLMTGLMDNMTLNWKDGSTKFNLSSPPRNRRSRQREMQQLAQTFVVPRIVVEAPSTPEDDSERNGQVAVSFHSEA